LPATPGGSCIRTIGSDEQLTPARIAEPTPAHTWFAVAGSVLSDVLLEWPPDVFALANIILDRSEAFRFALAPAGEWPPRSYLDWSGEVEEAARRWSAWVENRQVPFPDLIAQEWRVFREKAEAPLGQLARGEDRRLLEALLTLHAIADEACAGLAVALDTSDAEACIYRARGRELLARTGSLSRINAQFFRVLPKVRTPPTGRATFSRYACVVGPGIEIHWHKVPTRHRGTDLTSEHATLLCLPWPLQVRESDFVPVEGSVQRLSNEPFGFFEFAPAEGLDLDLLDRVLVAARQEAKSVDVVLLPECAVDASEIAGMESVLEHHGVAFLQAGVRQRPKEQGRFGHNWIHMGVSPRLEKGEPFSSEHSAAWFHIRQNKHHRWSLDESQIYQYHLGGVLHPHIRWWEATEVPRLAVQFVEVAELTLVGLVCEDLAWNDEVAKLMRSVGPTIVFTHLLDGPQLTSRWSARYASVLADDPGSAVATLTSYGMVQRSRPHGRDASQIIGLWKDPIRGFREIPLEEGEHGVLLTVCMDRATRRSSDGRWPVENGTHAFDVAIQQVKAATAGSGPPPPRFGESIRHILESEELTILTAWAEAVAEASAYDSTRVGAVLSDACTGATWRAAFGLPEPTPRLGEAIDSMGRLIRSAAQPDNTLTVESLLAPTNEDRPHEHGIDSVVRKVLLAMFEERLTRQRV
jgi:hypothetical protein